MSVSTEIPESYCKLCNTTFLTATNFEDKMPLPGDISICIKCGNIGKYDADMGIVELTPEEMLDIKNDKESWAEISKYVASVTALQGNEG